MHTVLNTADEEFSASQDGMRQADLTSGDALRSDVVLTFVQRVIDCSQNLAP